MGSVNVIYMKRPTFENTIVQAIAMYEWSEAENKRLRTALKNNDWQSLVRELYDIPEFVEALENYLEERVNKQKPLKGLGIMVSPREEVK